MNSTTNPQNPSCPNLKALQKWAPCTLQDAYKPRDPVKYLVPGMIELSSLNVVFGAPGSLKSFWLADLAVRVASGIGWLPPLPGQGGDSIKIIQSPVTWLDFDNGRRRTAERFAALGRNLNLPGDTPLYIYSMPAPTFDSRNDRHKDDVIDIIKFNQSKLVVIDNLGIISGGADENSNEMVKVMANLRFIAEETGAAVIPIHHQRKSNGSNSRPGETLRGHSSIEAALDLALLATREQDSEDITIKATKSRGAMIKPFSAKFTYQHDPAGELETAGFFSNSNLPATSKDKIYRAIIDCLGSNTYNKTDLSDQVHQSLNGAGKQIGINRISSCIDDLVAKGHLLKTPTGLNNAQLYSINPKKPY